MNVTSWDQQKWNQELQEHEIWVMTPQILLDALRLAFVRVRGVALLLSFLRQKKAHITCCVQCCILSVVSHVTILECFECHCCAYMVTVLILVTQVQRIMMPIVPCPKALTVVSA